jgi:hypothetical protein
MDLSEKLLARSVTAPFPFSYVHFGHGDPAATVTLPDSAGEHTLAAVGAFVRQVRHAAGRLLELSFVWQDANEPLSTWVTELPLELDALPDQTLAAAVEQALIAVEAPDETKEAELAAAEELLKVLYYLGSREARSVAVDERSAAMKDIGKKSAEQQRKVNQRSRGLYDHILVGPETSLADGLVGLSRRQSKVFVRRGHVHGYWTGKGRTVYVARLLDPIVVNKHLLEDGAEVPPPKDYKLH